ncbi:MAG: immunoglobulin domain-containing protein [Verrucomicrobia bacterium]|nr:immunoglobulin domain-containing protein [Verrucomicrobiota bacterium]
MPHRLHLVLLASIVPLCATAHGPDPRPVVAAAALAPGNFASNFRLTDHLGATRELFYESTAKAIVLVFTGTGSPRAAQTASALRALRARHSAADVVLWQIDPGPGADRAAIAAEQTLHNNDTPVLVDRAQLVATEYGVTRQLDTIVINSANWTLAYRGPLDNADPATLAAPTQNFAADAVASILAGREVARPLVEVPATAPALDLPAPPVPDYAADVAPIVIRSCVPCHSAGNIAPFVYAKYEDVQSRASQIRSVLLAQRMTPWHADPQYGVFANNAALTPAEIATLFAWVGAGAPRGPAPDPLVSAPPAAGGDWPLGPPDLIVSIPPQDLPATGVIAYRYLTVAVPVTTDRWLRAAVVKPGNRASVHHALVFDGTRLEVLLNAGGLGGFFAGYVPGMQQTWFPDGSGKLIRRGAQATFQIHYTTTGRTETDQTQMGFYFTDRAPGRELLTRSAFTANISIPPGAREYEREATLMPSTTRDVMLYELNPHMHYRGKRFSYEALYPDGTSEVLLNVPQYDFHWQSQYRLAQPKRLPAGTVLRARGAFDNSAQNNANPDPRAAVSFGEQTTDEMFVGYVNYAELSDRATVRPPVFSGNRVARAQVGAPFSFAVNADGAPTRHRAEGLPAGLTLDTATGVISGTPRTAGRHAVVVYSENEAGAAAAAIDLVVAAARIAPVFTVHPQSVRANIGDNVTLTAQVAAGPGTSYRWLFKGAEIGRSNESSLSLTNVNAASAGDYVCVATNAAGSVASAPATLSLGFTGLVNLSARASVGTGANVVIPGITVRGDKPKTLLLRAIGPALNAFGVSGALADPVISVFDAGGDKIFVNDDWGGVPDVARLKSVSAAQGAFVLPEGGRDAALLVTLPSGSYTVQVSGAGPGSAASGVAAVEIYEADATTSTLVNLSCRAHVGVDENILIAGFVIRGTASRRVLVRGIGPTLAAFGLTGTLANPQLEIYRQNVAAPVATNDDWDAESLASVFANVGAFALPGGSKDAALVVTLPPGTYTAQLSGVNRTTGLGIIEVYEVP